MLLKKKKIDIKLYYVLFNKLFNLYKFKKKAFYFTGLFFLDNAVRYAKIFNNLV